MTMETIGLTKSGRSRKGFSNRVQRKSRSGRIWGNEPRVKSAPYQPTSRRKRGIGRRDRELGLVKRGNFGAE